MYKFICIECNYKTNLKGDYKRHLNSMKHQRNIINSGFENVRQTKGIRTVVEVASA